MSQTLVEPLGVLYAGDRSAVGIARAARSLVEAVRLS